MFSLYIGLVHPRSNRASSIRFDSRSSIYNFRTPAWTGWLVHHQLFVNTGSPFETHACVYSRRCIGETRSLIFQVNASFFVDPIYSFLILFYFPVQLSCIFSVTPFFLYIYIYNIILNGSTAKNEEAKTDNLFIRISSHFYVFHSRNERPSSRHRRRTRSIEFYFRIARSPTLVFSPNTNSGP